MVPSRIRSLIVLLTIVAAAIAVPTPGLAATAAVVEYSVSDGAFGLTLGADGNVWFSGCTSGGPGHAGRITPAGTGSQFSGGSGCTFITSGPDGNLWFASNGPTPAIGRMTPQGAYSQFPLSFVPNKPIRGIVGGADGNIWFSAGDQIGRISIDGSTVMAFPLTAGSFAFGMTAGPDGNVWFAERFGNRIGRITPAGVVTEFGGLSPYASNCDPDWPGGPTGITLGSDGNLWFSEVCNGSIGRITPQGTVTEFAVPTADSKPWAIASGPDGNVWFTENKQMKIGRVTPSGVFDEFAVPPPATYTPGPGAPSYPYLLGITAGADGRLWFGTGFGVIGALTPPKVSQAQPYNPVVPSRVLDTRSGMGGSTIGGGQSINLAVAGRGGVAANATGVVMNVTVTNPSASGYLTIWPTGGTRPLASSLNFTAGQTIPNLVQVALGTGSVSIFNSSGSTDVIADVEGYTGPASKVGSGLFAPVTPSRLIDTRSSSPIVAGGTLDLQVGGAGGVPSSGASAVVLNVTVTNPTAGGYLTLWPSGAAKPLASNLNFSPAQTIPNRVEVQLGSNGKVSIFNSAGTSDVIVDVNGWYSDGSGAATTVGNFTGVSPTRLLDTRSTGSLGQGGVQSLSVTGGTSGVPSSGVTAVVLNVTVTGPTNSGFLTVWPAGAPRPTASDLNFTPGQTIPNLVVVGVSAQGTISIFNFAGTSDVIVDIAGWYS